MKTHLSFLLLIPLCLTGCSGDSWRAKYEALKAEDLYVKAYGLRIKRDPASHQERAGFYREACRRFLKALDLEPAVFTLSRIEEAADACLRVDQKEAEEKFRDFQDQYIRRHPTETEYGDAVPLTLE